MANSILGLDDAEAQLRAAHASGDKAALKEAALAYVASKKRFARQRALSSDMTGLGANDGTSKGRQLLEGVGAGMQNVGLRAARMLTPESEEGGLTKRIDEQSHIDKQMSGLQQGGKFAGEMIATAPVGGAFGGAVRGAAAGGRAALGLASKAPNVLTRALSYAAEGAGSGNLTADHAAGEGALANVALSPLLNRGGRFLRAMGVGMNRAPHAQTLLDYGADLTPGQMNPEGWLGRIERTAETSPLLGGGVKRARTQAVEPVVPNLAADMIERPRAPGVDLERTARRVKARKGQLYSETSNNPRVRPNANELTDFLKTVDASVKRHAPPNIQEIRNEIAPKLSRLMRAKSNNEIKEILSDLKTASRSLKYSKEAKGAGRFETAKVFDDVAAWIDRFHKKGMTPGQLGRLEKADRITAEYAPLQRGIEAAQKGGRASPSGKQLLGGLRRNMTRGQFTEGGGGRTREVADALVEHEKPRGGGFIERMPVLRAALGTALLPVAAAASSTPVRRILQGSLGPQRALRRVVKHHPKTGRFLKQSLSGLRSGAGAAAQTDDEETY